MYHRAVVGLLLLCITAEALAGYGLYVGGKRPDSDDGKGTEKGREVDEHLSGHDEDEKDQHAAYDGSVSQGDDEDSSHNIHSTKGTDEEDFSHTSGHNTTHSSIKFSDTYYSTEIDTDSSLKDVDEQITEEVYKDKGGHKGTKGHKGKGGHKGTGGHKAKAGHKGKDGKHDEVGRGSKGSNGRGSVSEHNSDEYVGAGGEPNGNEDKYSYGKKNKGAASFHPRVAKPFPRHPGGFHPKHNEGPHPRHPDGSFSRSHPQGFHHPPRHPQGFHQRPKHPQGFHPARPEGYHYHASNPSPHRHPENFHPYHGQHEGYPGMQQPFVNYR